MKRHAFLIMMFLTASTLAGCNGSFGRFFDKMGLTGAPAVSNGTITVSAVGTSSATLAFAEASDSEDTPDKLTYLVIYSSVASVATVSDPDALPEGVQSYGWIQYPAAGSVTITGLVSGATYSVNIIVKNSRTLCAMYTAASATTTAAEKPAISAAAITASSVTAVSAAVSFSAATVSSGTLSYMVVYSTADQLGAITDYNILPAGATKINWQSYPSPISLTSLSPGTTYFVNVIVKTDSGAFAVYEGTSFTTLSTYLPTVPSGSLTPLAVDESSITFSFDEAVNNSGAASALQYLIAYATSDTFSTVTSPDSLPADIHASGTWRSYPAAPVTISGLTRGTTYYYNVFVKNSYGFALYATASATPHDVTPPTAGTLSAVKDGTTPTTKINLTFGKGTDQVTTDDKLEYKVVFAESVIDQVNTANAISSTYLLQDWKAFSVSNGSISASGLSPNTKYYFNVLVRDEAGNMTLYACANATTAASAGDTQAPTLSSPTVTAAAGSSQWLANLSWTRATDPIGTGSTHSADSALKYKVVASTSAITSSNFTSMPAVSNDWVTDIATLSNIPVADGVTTNFMVAVKDEAGNIGYYTQASYTPASLQSSLLCYYKFDNARADYTANTTASVTGTESYSADAAIGGYAFNFSGNTTGTNYLEIAPTAAIQNLTANFTVSFWIKVNSFTNSYEEIISRGGVRGYKIQRYGTTNKLLFIITHDWNSTAQSRVVSTTEVADGTWHHIACTYAPGGSVGNEKIFMYIDGSSQGAFSGGTDDNWYNTSYSSVCFTSTGDKIQMGENTSHAAEKYTGLLDEVRIYSKVLSSDEIKALGR